MEDTITKKIIEHALKMCIIAERDQTILGDCYLQFNERGMTVIDPKNVTLKYEKNKSKAEVILTHGH